MAVISRRQFSKAAGLGIGALTFPNLALSAKPKVVIIGGGAGGATAARHISKETNGAVDVTLIEASRRYYTCFYSNLYLGGYRSYASIGHNYYGLAVKHGVNIIHEWAISIDPSRRLVKLGSGASTPYDRLILSPGIDFKYESVPGYTPEVQSRMPHAWRSGTQTQLLRSQVLNMKKGGIFVMVPPTNPYRCPPAPYERVSMVANLLKYNNPTAKIIILDPKPKFAKQGLFMDGWEHHYPGIVEWIDPEIHGGIQSINVSKMEFVTDLDTFTADAACVIPAQKAGAIAIAAGVNDGDWCPVHPNTMASKADPNMYVLGDASVAKSMPKSGSSANSQAKVAVNAICHELIGTAILPAQYTNTCWSLIATNDAVKVGANYKAGVNKIEVVSKFISKKDETAQVRKSTYEESIDWYKAITADMFS